MDDIADRLTILFANKHFKICFGKEGLLEYDLWTTYLKSIGCNRLTVSSDREGFVFIYDPSPFIFSRFIAVPKETAIKILVLGMP